MNQKIEARIQRSEAERGTRYFLKSRERVSAVQNRVKARRHGASYYLSKQPRTPRTSLDWASGRKTSETCSTWLKSYQGTGIIMTTEEMSVYTFEVNPQKARIPPKQGRLFASGTQQQPSPGMMWVPTSRTQNQFSAAWHGLALFLLKVSWWCDLAALSSCITVSH